MISLQIDAAGGIAMLHDDAVNLGDFGEIEVTRASHVEFSDGKTPLPLADGAVTMLNRGWYVQSARTLKVIYHGLPTRAEALAWEKAYYAPGGEGWAELTQEVA